MKDRKAFTLVELLIVVGIIGILGGVMLATFSGSTESAMATKCLNNMRSLCNAVLAEASKLGYYPSAGPYRHYDLDDDDYDGKVDDIVQRQGWIGYVNGTAPVSCYYQARDNGDDQYYAITNGTIWKAMKGQRSAYVCPTHIAHCKKSKLPTPAWSYAMNSYFGYDFGIASSRASGTRNYGEGYFRFKYTKKPEDRQRPPEKVLLFAEIPFVANGVQTPEYLTSSSTENDMILQYKNDSGGVRKSNKSAPSESDAEAIGFNHKAGQNYSAHVAFADGHCAKLVLPPKSDEENLADLTTLLCTGQEYSMEFGRYNKAGQ